MFKEISLYQYIILGSLIVLDILVYVQTGVLHEGITGALIGAMAMTTKSKEGN